MVESSLKAIIELIDAHDEVNLRKALSEDNSEINQYYDMDVDVDSKLSVRVSPLQFAVKVKAPKCVEVLLEYGADIKMRLKTSENKSLPITALTLAEGERDMALKNKRENDIETYDEIVRLIKEHEKKKKKKKKRTDAKDDKQEETEVLLLAESPAGSNGLSASEPRSQTSTFLYSIDTKSANQLNAPSSDFVTSASSSTSMPTIIPPSPSSALDMHKVTLRATQNHLAIKKLEEKNDLLQKEVDQLRQDIELIKKLVVSLDLQQNSKKEDEKDSTKTVGKVNSEKSIPKPKDKPKAKSNTVTPVKRVDRDEEDDESHENSAVESKKSVSSSNTNSKKDKSKTPREDKEKSPSSAKASKKTTGKWKS